MKSIKPIKKTDYELNQLIDKKIGTGDYVFLNHAKQRLQERNISDIDVLNILEGKRGYCKRRNKSKDTYEDGRQDWKYCFEGTNPDSVKIRLIISFDEELLLVITVIRLE